MSYLCITVCWLDDRYHGQDADGEPEWPPSPLRLFQAMLAGVCWRHDRIDPFLPSLRFLQELPAPIIIAPRAQAGHPFARFVPNNDSDKVFNRQNRLATKTVCPTLLLEPLPIRYLWRLPEPFTGDMRRWADDLCEIARCVVIFGWGIDMAVATGLIESEEHIKALPGERWLPNEDGSSPLRRTPSPATLDALLEHYKLFANRLQMARDGRDGTALRDCLSDVPPLDESAFDIAGYRRATDPPQRPFAAFSILKPDAAGFQPFDTTVRKALTVAGMTRCATKRAAERWGGKWTTEEINAFILGHGEPINDGGGHVAVGPRRFAYFPLPSIQSRGEGKACVVGGVRRVMLYCFADGCDKEITWARRALSGQQLIEKKAEQAAALLSVIPKTDNVVRGYTQRADAWATVTPVVLPGYDDPKHYRRRMKAGTAADEQKRLLEHLDDRIESLVRKAIAQAGFSQILAENAGLEWRKSGFWPGNDLADRYGVPDHLKRFPRYHVKIRWRDGEGNPVEVPGPICIGGGRYYGIGLFAALGGH